MKKSFISVTILICSFIVNAQVGIGTSTPEASAKLDVTSTNKGFLPPRVALTATNSASPITSPAAGLLVYNTATAGTSPNNVVPGYYYWNGTAWVNITANGVPYSGATGAVNLGNYDLTVYGIKVGRGGGAVFTNTAVGEVALSANTVGTNNAAHGYGALANNTTGSQNSAFGYGSLSANTSGQYNTAVGRHALTANTTGESNTATGVEALTNSQTGSNNTSTGDMSLRLNVAGSGNSGFGAMTLYNNLGDYNSALGFQALTSNTTGMGNTALGSFANVGQNGLSNATAIGYGATVSASNSIQLGNSSVTSINTSGTISSAGFVKTGGTSAQFLMADGSATSSPSLSSATGLSLSTGVTGTLGVQNGGTGATTITGIVKGNGTNAFTAAVAGTDYQAPLTNPVTGTGTMNYLSKFTGSTSVGSSQIFDNATSVGIGVNSPSASAKLEISSTTQGFLPPRMTYAQRTSIANPAQGLIVYCTNCGNNGELQVYNGSSWTNMVGGATQLGIGQSAYGGKIAYIFQPGDPGYVAGEIHGIIASNDEWTTAWGCVGQILSGASGTEMGTGSQNTIDIVNGCTTAGIAARVCADYSVTDNGVVYSDWHLPSIRELQRILANRQAVGGFNSPYISYWSSSQNGSDHAYVIRTDNPGTDYVTHKSGGDYGIGTRAVRLF